jgi:uncharacterized protein (DUF2141 family)
MAGNIIVKVTDIVNKEGKLFIGLYNKDDDTFASTSKYYKVINLFIESNETRYTFKNISNGIYAIAIFHDENGNKELDTNIFGIPSEGYGFSNNIRPKFRPASFEEAKFVLDDNISVTIKMGY